MNNGFSVDRSGLGNQSNFVINSLLLHLHVIQQNYISNQVIGVTTDVAYVPQNLKEIIHKSENIIDIASLLLQNMHSDTNEQKIEVQNGDLVLQLAHAKLKYIALRLGLQIDVKYAFRSLIVRRNRPIELSYQELRCYLKDANSTNSRYKTSTWKQYFEIININTKAVTKIPAYGNSWGITYESGNLYMIVDGHGINVAIMTSSGEPIKKIPVSTDFDQTEYMAVFGNSIFFTVFIPKNLVCIDIHGAVQWQFKKSIFNQPRGVTTDTLGNVFVAGFASHNVIAVQKSGSEGTEILNKNEGLDYPTSIFCDKMNNRLLVSNLNNGHAHLFNIVYN
ncbi:unnamed protein product [Mytilus coruscus]|uniref:Uncharacterized protein n=1 Tax=Mytilus coruscus TaxID=42192 RepID=A0A6J8CQN8_MYTCO|nr:unnamed protein product [Mytilus coruscus]